MKLIRSPGYVRDTCAAFLVYGEYVPQNWRDSRCRISQLVKE